MPNYWDIAVQDKNGKLVLIVELKIKKDINLVNWASKSYYNLRVNGLIDPYLPYFLLAFPTVFYLWDNDDLKFKQEENLIIPNYTINSQFMLHPYYDRTNTTPDNINGYGLEIIISSWLKDIISGDIDVYQEKQYEDWLIKSGLYKSIINGKLNYEIAV